MATLFDFYGKDNARNELTSALSKVRYNQTIADEPERMWKFVNTYSFITLFNIKIHLDDGGSNGLEKDQDVPERFSLSSLLANFKDSPAFKLIMKDNDDKPFISFRPSQLK